MVRLLLVLAFIFISSTADASMAIPLELKEMTDQAGQIFVGRCLDVSHELDERGLPSTYIRFEVVDALKGVPAGNETVLVKQYGVPPKRMMPREGEKVILPFYPVHTPQLATTPGEELLLLLYPESSYGFTSAVGLGQGRFLIRRDNAGAAAVQSLSIRPNREMNLDDLVREIRGYLKNEE